MATSPNSKRLTRRASATGFFPTTALRRGILGVFAHAPAPDDSLLKAFMLGSARPSPFECVRRAHGVTRADVRRGRSLYRVPTTSSGKRRAAPSVERTRSLSRSSDSDDGVSIEESLGRVAQGMCAASPPQGKPLGCPRRSACKPAAKKASSASRDLASAAAAAAGAKFKDQGTAAPLASVCDETPSVAATSLLSPPHEGISGGERAESGFLRDIDAFPSNLSGPSGLESVAESFFTAAGGINDPSDVWHVPDER